MLKLLINSEFKAFEIAAPAVAARNRGNIRNEVTKIYPNPISNNGILNVSTPADNTIFSIYDVLGRKVSQGKVHSEDTIDVSSLKQGLYIVTLIVEGKRFTHQVVKQ